MPQGFYNEGMGSFRIVRGRGNARHEYLQGSAELLKAFDNMREALNIEPTPRPKTTRHTKKQLDGQKVAKALTDTARIKAMKTLKRKVDRWKEETIAEFKASVPVDTGNLRNSIGVIQYDIDKDNGKIKCVVGVDEHKITPPPKHMRRREGAGPMRTMPDYDYSPYVLGDEAPYGGTSYAVVDDVGRGVARRGGTKISSVFSNRSLSQIARKNAKKIMGS